VLVVSVAECLTPGGAGSGIRSGFGRVLVRYGQREWKDDMFKQTVGSAEERRSFPDMETTTLSKISHGSSRHDHLRHSTSTSHYAKSSILSGTDLTIVTPAWHASLRWRPRPRDTAPSNDPKPSSAPNVANTGDVSNLLSVVLTSLPAVSVRARITALRHGMAHFDDANLTLEKCNARNRDAACRPLGLFHEDAISRIGGSTWESALTISRCQRPEQTTRYLLPVHTVALW
jgi:hypothetical protein